MAAFLRIISILGGLVLFLAMVASANAAWTQREQQQHLEDLVVDLTGQPTVSFQHYAGYVRISEHKSLFYWFFEAMEEPATKPLVLWLNGGPGCSSISYGALRELGPFLLNNDGLTLRFNPYAWNKVANVVFLDSPAGVGFSYSNSSSDSEQLSDRSTAEDSYAFLLGWFGKFSRYNSHELYIAGESYAGHYVPQLAEFIHAQNEIAEKSKYINLKGIMIGNPLLEEDVVEIMAVELAWNRGMIPRNLYRAIMGECKQATPSQVDEKKLARCTELFADFQGYLVGIDFYGINTPICSNFTSSRREEIGSGFAKEPLGYDPCAFSNLQLNVQSAYLSKEDVQKALHANVTGIPYPYSSCSAKLRASYNTSTVPTAIPSIRNLLNAGYRVWVYSGDADMAVSFEATRHSIMKMKLTEKAWNKWGGWRSWYYEDQVAGWMTEYEEGLTFLSVRGAGHMVPAYAPATSLAVLSHFLKGEPLPSNFTAAAT